MTAAREKNFISAVVYLHNEEGRAAGFLEMLRKVLEERFEQYEIVAVDDASSDGTAQEVRRFAAEQMEKPLTLLHMSLRQGREKCMNAGQDCAIGDFVYEFDSILTPYPEALIFQAYQTALQGSDVVTVGPSRVRAGSRLFYGVFNRFSRSAYPLGTDAFCLLSRRAINRVHAQSAGLAYRKAAYAASGLRVSSLTFEGALQGSRGGDLDLAVDSLALYTDAGYRVSLAVTGCMFCLALAELLYTLAIFFRGDFVEGWVTTMFVLTLGLAGLFLVLTIVVKYLSLILKLTFEKQDYLVESIEKFQK
ncbi:MAG: glycosyltransferase [Bacteroidales bacterium]|nr:glycosyltransferase [Fournierella massiliensis]MCF2556696.1 glycosyltransferase [Fournierella massiliensis]MCI6739955.1 glycosyltransferase [Bacteroidales bacterium]